MIKKKVHARHVRHSMINSSYDGVAKFGQWIFLTGILISLGAGILSQGLYNQVIWVLGLLGVIVGIVNLSLRDEIPFLIAVLVVLTSANSFSLILNSLPLLGAQLESAITYISVFVVPAGFIVAIKAIFTFARS